MISLVFLVAIIIIAGVLIARLRRKTRFGSTKDGVSVTRHLWLYLITFLALGTFTSGIGLLLNLVFDLTIKNPHLVEIGRTAFDKQQLSLGIAMVVIGGPLWFIFWRTAQRHVRDNLGDPENAVRKVFLHGILLISGLMAIVAASELVVWLFSGVPVSDFPSDSAVFLIVGSILWGYHYFISEREGNSLSGSKTIRRWYVYILAGFGLVWLAEGIVRLVNLAVTTSSIWGNTFLPGNFWDNPAMLSLAHVLLGGVVWYFHWFRMASDDFDSTLRQVYLYILTIAGSAVAVLVALTNLLYRILDWLFGGVSGSSSSYFQFLGWTLPLALIGLSLWAYHIRLTQHEAGSEEEKRQSVQRIAVYLMSFLGLGMIVTGISFLLGLCVDLIRNAIESMTIGGNVWQSQLALSLSLLVLGTPIWLYYWNRVLKRVRLEEVEEQRALSRRIYLYLVVGASIIIVAVDLVNIIYQLLNGLLQEGSSSSFLRDAKWSLQTVFVAIPLFWYHWQKLRIDQRFTAEKAGKRHEVTFLVMNQSVHLIDQLEKELGLKIKVLHQLGNVTEGVPLSDADLQIAANEIKESPYEKILLMTIAGKITLLPYEE